MTHFQKKLFAGLFIMALLSPLGIILPQKFNAEEAWGEWGAETLQKLLGYVPEGLKKYADIWKAPIPDYNFGGETAPMTTQIISYVISGLLGIIIIGLAVFGISKLLGRRGK